MENSILGSRYLGSNITVRNVLTGEVRIESSDVISQYNYYGGGHYTDYGLYVENSRVVVSGTLFSENGYNTADYALFATRDSIITVTNSEFRDNDGWAVRVGADDVHRVAGNTFDNNGYDRVLISSGSVVTGSVLTVQGGLQAYEMEGDLNVPAGVTLTVNPGVLVMGRSDAELQVNGHLQAIGVATSPIIFTSVNNAQPDTWRGLVFDGSAAPAMGGGTGVLRHVTVRYGGDGNSILGTGSYDPGSNIAVRDVLTGAVRIEQCRLLAEYARHGSNYSEDYGLYVENSRVVVSGTLFSGNGDNSDDYALYATRDSIITVTNSEFRDNDGWAVRVGAEDVHRVTGNTFSGNGYDRVLISYGSVMTGASLTDQRGLQAYQLSGDLSVPSGVTLTVHPSVTVMGQGGVEIKVLGHLAAVGEAQHPITFTSASDDGPYQWSGLVFDKGTGMLRHAIVRYAGGGNSVLDPSNSRYPGSNITVRNVLTGEVHIESSKVISQYNYYGGRPYKDYGLYVENSRVVVSGTLFSENGYDSDDYALYATRDSIITVTNSEFRDNDGWAVRVGAEGVHRVTGNTFSGNRYDRVLISYGSVMTGASLTDQRGLQAYQLSGDLSVPSGVTLTVHPSVTVMGQGGVEIKVLGHLAAVGEAQHPITFTSASDSGPYQWSGLVFDKGTGNLRHVTVRYGGYTDSVLDRDYVGSNITVRNVLTGEVRIESSDVISQYNYYGNNHRVDYGLYVENSQVVVSGTLFSDNGYNSDDYALYGTGMSTTLTITNAKFYHNGGFGLYTVGGVALTMTGSTFVGNGYYPLRTKADNLHRALEGNTFAGNSPNRLLTWGTIMADVVFTNTNGLNAYELSSDLSVLTDTTLTVSPGTVVMGWSEAELYVRGHLDAIGNARHPITFTSASDSGPYQWSGLVFDGGTGDLRYVTMRYGGHSDSVFSSIAMGSNISVRNVLTGEVRIESSRVISEYNYYSNYHRTDYGLYVENSNVVIHDTLFADNGNNASDTALYVIGDSSMVTVTRSIFRRNPGTAIAVKTGQMLVSCVTLSDYDKAITFDGGDLTVQGVSMMGGNYGLQNTSSVEVDARYNWWGSETGPYHSFLNPDGAGDQVSDNVVFEPWLDAARCVVDLAITKSGFPDPVAVGGTLTYTLNAVNRSLIDATAVTVTDRLPWNLTLVSAVPSAGTCQTVGGDITCAVGDLAQGEIATVTVVATAPLTTGMVSNLAGVRGAEDDPYTDNNAVKQSTLGAPADSADVSVSKATSIVAGGHPMTYTLTVVNQGPADATGVILTDTLPGGLALTSVTPTQGSCEVTGTNVIACDLGNLAAYETSTVAVLATAPLTTGQIINLAEVRAQEPDPRWANNAAKTYDWVSGPRAICVPGVHDTWNGLTVTLKGIIRGGGPNLVYQWDFGDGEYSPVLTFTDRYAISATHMYTDMVVDVDNPTMITARLIVTDTDTGVHHVDVYHLAVRERDLEVEVNVAIDEALWYLHTTMTRTEVMDVDVGHWLWSGSHVHGVGYAGMATLAFEIQGHLLTGDYDEDPYVETVQRGINYILDHTYAVDIPVQPAGDPDSNDNGLGLVSEDGSTGYEAGISLMALVDSGAHRQRAEIGPLEVRGRAYYDIAQDMVDWMAYAQEDDGNARGGWRYTANSGADMSVTQWPVLGMEGASVNWGIKPPDWVKTELRDNFLSYAQGSTGGFGYTGPGSDILLTGSGLVCLAFAGVPSDNYRVVSATQFIADNWTNSKNIGNFYGMYGIMKGSRLTSPPIQFYGEHEWYKEYAEYLVAHQYADGHWKREDGYGGVPIDTAWGVLILSPRVFVGGADLMVTKVGSSDSLNPGEVLTYTLTITNNGPAEATSIVLTDTLPSDVLLASLASDDADWDPALDCVQAGRDVRCDLERLAMADAVALTLVVTPTIKAGLITNTVRVAGNELDPDTSNNEDWVLTPIACTCSPDVYEDDDGPAQAVALTTRVTQTHNFCEDAVDWLTFTAQANTVYTITTSAWGRRADTVLTLFDTDAQTVLAANDDYTGDYASRVVWVASQGGVYYVRVTNRTAIKGCYNEYDVWLERREIRISYIYLPLVSRDYSPATLATEGSTLSPNPLPQSFEREEMYVPSGVITHTCPDAYEVDDTWWQASPIQSGEVQLHSFDSDPERYVADKDFVWLDMRAGETVTFTMLMVTNTQTLMELYDAQGDAVYDRRTEDRGCGWACALTQAGADYQVTGTQQLVWKATASGRYHLGVVPLSTTFGCTRTVAYHLSAVLLPLRELYLPLIMRDPGATR
jgi:uncharacterized repeat protein (TIGR01451 family)